MDGTIIDSEWAHEEAKVTIMKELGGKADIDLNYFIGRSNRLFWQTVLDRMGMEGDVDELVKKQFDHVLSALRRAGQRESPGLTELLRFIRKNGMRAAVCTGSEEYFAREILGHLGIEPYFDVVITGAETRVLKPAPDIYLAALAKAGADARRAVAVEDSRSGVMAVHAAGMRCAGYTMNGANPQDLREADWPIERMTDLIDILRAPAAQ